MGLKEDLESEIKNIFREAWTIRDGEVVPEPEDLKLSNDGVRMEATILYADLAESTQLVDSQTETFAAEIYKTYLICAARIIKEQNGVITAYDGDRVMGVFKDGTKNTNAVRAALMINYAVNEIVNPALKGVYSSSTYTVRQTVGIDVSKLLVSRIGVRNDNDLVWVGRAANYAAKLSSLNSGYKTYITYSVYDHMLDEVRYGGLLNQNMWTQLTWSGMNNLRIYGSSWQWAV